MAALEGKTNMERLKQLSAKCYRDQAIWFLNAFYADKFEGKDSECEMVWKYTNKMIELDLKKKKKGCELNEFDAHRFLEGFGMTLSVKDMREKLREIDIDFNKHVSLTEFLVYKYKADVTQLTTASQGEKDMKKINEAETLLKKAQADCEAAKARAEEARAAEAKARESKLAAIKAEQEAKKEEAKLRKVKEEQYVAAEALRMEQKKFTEKCDRLRRKSKNPKFGVVKRGKAANDLAQLESKDPLPLQRAKITQEAVVKKCARAEKRAAKFTKKAIAARELAEADEAKAQAAREAADAAVVEAEAAINKAQEFLEKVKKEVKGAGKGKLWFMDRELEEAKKYMPKSKLSKLSAKLAREKLRI